MQTSKEVIDFDNGIRERLRSLLERYPQAEIARRCNTTPSNVSRYLRDTKIPAELCAAAVGGLGVHLITALTDRQSYHRLDGCNILRLIKLLDDHPDRAAV